jgi:transcriptional regulator with XRE-family HTH domain
MLPDFVDRASTYVLEIFRQRITPADRKFAGIGRRLGVSAQTVQRWWTGERGIGSLAYVQGLALELGLRMSDVAEAVGDDDASRLFYVGEVAKDKINLIYEAHMAGGEVLDILNKAMDMVASMNKK